MPVRPALAAVALLAGIAPAHAAGCDLDKVVRYQLVLAKTIDAHVDDGKQTYGFDGCMPGRILVFTDHSAIRCKGSAVSVPLQVPKAWLFARGHDDLKLCVEDEFYDVEEMH